MKKNLMRCAIIMMVCVFLSGCNFNSNVYDNTGNTEMPSADKVAEMLNELSAGDFEAAVVLLHPQLQDSRNQIDQLIDYLAGRGVEQLEQTGMSINTSKGTSGTAKQENGAFRIELDDGTVCYLSVSYLTDGTGEGFISFQLVLGLV